MYDVCHTEREYWNGQNMLGKVLTELAVEFWGEYPKPKENDSSYESLDTGYEDPNGAMSSSKSLSI